MAGVREIVWTIPFDGTVADILHDFYGVSSGVCTQLRRTLGTVSVSDGEAWHPVRLPDRVQAGERLRILLPTETPESVPRYPIDVPILYQDDDIAIVSKPHGLATIPVHGHYGRALPNALACKWGDFVYRPVHRLDRDTSGLMVIARNRLAHGILSGSGMQRDYLALCQGKTELSGTIRVPIGAHPSDPFLRSVRQDGLPACTHYVRLAYRDDVSLLRLHLETGRTHQIRLHMAYLGHPLCGDLPYGGTACGGMQDRHALHSARVELVHPIRRNRCLWTQVPDFVAPYADTELVEAGLQRAFDTL